MFNTIKNLIPFAKKSDDDNIPEVHLQKNEPKVRGSEGTTSMNYSENKSFINSNVNCNGYASLTGARIKTF